MVALSAYLRRILSAVLAQAPSIPVDGRGEPEADAVRRVAAAMGEDPDEVRQALLWLRASDCFTEDTLEIPGLEPLTWWRVHPQLLDGPDRAG